MADEIKVKMSEFAQATQVNNADDIIILQNGENKKVKSPVLESKIINRTVDELSKDGGVALNLVNLKGVVTTYANLPTTNLQVNDAYQVEADGLVYVYTSTGFQPNGQGFEIQPNVNGVVEEGNTEAVSGGEVYNKTLTRSKYMTPGVNLINPENIIHGKFFSVVTGTMTDRENAYGIWLSNLPNGKYFIQGRTLALGGRPEVAFFNSKEDSVPVSYVTILAATGGVFTIDSTTPKNIFVNIALTSDITPFLSTFMISLGIVEKPFEPYKEVFNVDYLPAIKKIALGVVNKDNFSIELIKSLVESNPSNNLFNKKNITLKGMIRSNGSITYNSTDLYAITEFIPITEDGIIINPNTLHANGYNALFDDNFTYISGTATKNAYLPFVTNAKYACFSVIVANVNSIMINKGNVPLTYEPYNPIYGYLKDLDIEGLKIQLAIPATVPAVIDDNLQLYKSGVFVNCNKYSYDYKFVSPEGKSFPDYFQLKPTTSGNLSSYVVVKDSDGKTLLNKPFTIRKLAKLTTPSTQKNILCMGASATASRYWPLELKRRLTTNSGDGTPMNPTGLNLSNISFVGRKTNANMNVNIEATGGWSWLDYTTEGRPAYRIQVSNVTNIYLGTIYTQGGLQLEIVEINTTGNTGEIRMAFYGGSGTLTTNGVLTRSGGSGDSTITYTNAQLEAYNPFWHNGKLDFINYANLYCNGSITTLIAHCGVNDIFSGATMEVIISRIRTFANALFTDFPNCKFIVSSLPLPCPIGGMTWSYNASATNDYYTKALQFLDFFNALENLQNETAYVGKLYHSAVVPQFDNLNSYPTNLDLDPVQIFYANNRSTKEIIVGTNGVHPKEEGSKLVADAIYRTLHLTGL